MTEPTTDNDRHEAAISQARAEMALAAKEQTLEIFGELLERLWERLIGLIGETATVAVFRSALLETSRDHFILQEIDIENSGIDLERLKKTLNALESSAIRSGLLAFTENVMTLLIDLTGGILLRKVEPLMQQFKEKLEQT
ncbi:MAG: hypothetical protein KME08_15455 [Aphanothece sp. CMT-3BRIN-NPC111]|jgi:hypothetical protein|nr:hypothetical protein [Aphanothece sp. CMT-3BRIN-NPC111]